MRTLFFLFLLSITILSCQKSNSPDNPTIPPGVSSSEIGSITSNSVVIAVNVSADGRESITARGVCWKNSPTPDISGSHTTDGIGTGTFNSSITGLIPGTTYYVRAYATNSRGTAYGSELSFTTSTPDVYVTGIESNGTKNVAKVWKNGTPTNLTDGNFNATAYSVFVSGSDVYVAGSENNASGALPKVWKNGTATTLSNVAESYAYSVFVSGTDVYVAGEENLPTNLVARLWKNGTSVPLGGSTISSFASSVHVSGEDVFVGGDNISPTYVPNAATWKNGTMTTFTNVYGVIYSVFAAGSDLYAAGVEKPAATTLAKVWKNGVGTSLTDGTNTSGALSVYVVGSDVYVAGYESNGTKTVAKVWKNGVGTSLTDGTNNAGARSVYVVGSDVYVAGYENNGAKDVAKVWKNGVVTSLTNGTNWAAANSVFVK